MGRPKTLFGVGVSALALVLTWPSLALASSPPTLDTPTGLSFAEIKITGTEFILLQNNSGADIAASDLANYWIYEFNNNNPLASGVSSSTQQLPAAALANGQTILLSADGGQTCGAAVTDNLSLSLTDTTGYLEVVHQSLVGGVLTSTAGDTVSWTSASSPTAGAQIVTPTSSSAKTSFASYRYQQSASPLTFWWQPASVDSTNSCQLDVTISGTSTPGPSNPGNQLAPSSPPPAEIITLASSSTSTGMAASDVGLKAPQITELLPNPAPPTSDADGEFVELYNSNTVSFDLSNFVLETGLNTKHKYTFPAGLVLKAGSFTAFKLKGTGLSLSNTADLAELFDPSGNLISKTDEYASAKDGQAWALANDKWYWTTTPTPSAENVINQASASSSKSAAPQVLPSTGGISGKTSSAATVASQVSQPAPIHGWTLAGVGAAALLYAGYEYRVDLANNLYRIRRYFAARRTAGK